LLRLLLLHCQQISDGSFTQVVRNLFFALKRLIDVDVPDVGRARSDIFLAFRSRIRPEIIVFCVRLSLAARSRNSLSLARLEVIRQR